MVNDNLTPNIIPDYIRKYCNSNNLLACDFYLSRFCPDTCNFAMRIKQGIFHTSRTGLERFLARQEHARQKGFNWSGDVVPNELNGEFLG